MKIVVVGKHSTAITQEMQYWRLVDIAYALEKDGLALSLVVTQQEEDKPDA